MLNMCTDIVKMCTWPRRCNLKVGGFNSELCKFQVVWKFQAQNPYVSQKLPVFSVRIDTTNSEARPGQGSDR